MKKKFTILCAYDVPCYATIEVEAESIQEAARMIDDHFDKHTDGATFDPDWSQGDNFRAYVENDKGDYVSTDEIH